MKITAVTPTGGALLVCLGLAEALLRVYEKLSVRDRTVTEDSLEKDAELGFRLPPGVAGHDARGFRNESALERADLVALGDSQTWGINGAREEAWPQQLARLSGRTVYQMSLGGYGPVQYRALTPRALALAPRAVVVGLYFGNDLYDAYAMTYLQEAHASLRAEGATADLTHDTVGVRARELWDQEKNFLAGYRRPGLAGWRDWLSGHTATGRLLARAGLWPGVRDVEFETARAWARAFPDRGAVFDGEGPRTVFTTAYRLTGLDPSEPRVAEGLRVTKEMLVRIKADTDAAGVRLLVLLIPTKETAYADLLRERGVSAGEVFDRLIGAEAEARAQVVSLCGQAGLACVDALPALSDAVRRGEQLYPASTESHPNAAGYHLLATVVREELEKRGW